MEYLTNIQDLFIDLPFEIKGIGSFILLNGVTVVALRDSNGEYNPIQFDESQQGYIRTSGITTFTKVEPLDCDDSIYKAVEEITLVLYTNKYTIESLKMKLLSLLKGLRIVRIVTDRQTIFSEEFIKNNEYDFIKVVFNYEYDYLNDCEDGELECIC
jgi:hypothetical protein